MSLFDELNTLDDLRRKLREPSVPESETLVYKSAGVKLGPDDLDDVSRDITALANSLGGLIVYGMGRDLERIHEANANWLRHQIPMLSRYPIHGIRMKAIPQSGPVEALLVEVPASYAAPHQARDNRYYRRNGARTDAMSHDLIE